MDELEPDEDEEEVREEELLLPVENRVVADRRLADPPDDDLALEPEAELPRLDDVVEGAPAPDGALLMVPPPRPLMPPPNEPPRLPPMRGAIRFAERSACVVPVRRIVLSSVPDPIVEVRMATVWTGAVVSGVRKVYQAAAAPTTTSAATAKPRRFPPASGEDAVCSG